LFKATVPDIFIEMECDGDSIRPGAPCLFNKNTLVSV